MLEFPLPKDWADCTVWGNSLSLQRNAKRTFSHNTLTYMARAKDIIANSRELLGKDWVRYCASALQRDRPGK